MSTACQILHEHFTALPHLTANYEEGDIPANGIYILYEKNEFAHGTGRIVRIGTHTGQGNLPKRLKEHLFTPNKDRSIFRKHIGRCLLNKDNDPFLADWDISLIKRKDRLLYENRIDPKKLAETERAVTDYMQENFSFIVFEIVEKEERLALETALIATVAQCKNCWPSSDWLGMHHPNGKIPKHGLWNVLGLNGVPLDPDEAGSLFLTPPHAADS